MLTDIHPKSLFELLVEQAQDLLLRLLKLSDLLSIAFFDFLHLLGNCLLDGPLELWIAALFLVGR